MESIIQSTLQNGGYSLYAILIVFFTGLLTSLTPCVYPMIPITVSVVGSQSKSKKQSIALSLTYVLGLAMIYAGLGVLAASTGHLFGSVASHPLTLALVGIFCLFMAAWMAGLFSLPSFIQPKQTNFSSVYLNVFVAGCFSGLVMAPCTSPVLGMLLMYVASTGDLIWSSLLMFVFAFGMSALLILVGSVSGTLVSLPKSGNWLNGVKWLMAAFMFVVACYLFYQSLS